MQSKTNLIIYHNHDDKICLFITLWIWILLSSLVVVAVQSLSLTLCDPVDCSTPSFLSFTIYLSLLKLKSTGASSVGKESACQYRRHKRCGFDPWVGKIPWKRKWQPTPIFLPGKSHGQRSLVCYSPWCCKLSNSTTASNRYETLLHNAWNLSTVDVRCTLNLPLSTRKMFIWKG